MELGLINNLKKKSGNTDVIWITLDSLCEVRFAGSIENAIRYSFWSSGSWHRITLVLYILKDASRCVHYINYLIHVCIYKLIYSMTGFCQSTDCLSIYIILCNKTVHTKFATCTCILWMFRHGYSQFKHTFFNIHLSIA